MQMRFSWEFDIVKKSISQVTFPDIQLRKLHASLESLVVQRRDLVKNTADFAKSCALLSNAEEHTGRLRMGICYQFSACGGCHNIIHNLLINKSIKL